MSNPTALLADYPKLADLPETDLKDVLSDEQLCNAVLFTQPAVKAVMDEQEKLSRDNEELASECPGGISGFGWVSVADSIPSDSTWSREESGAAERPDGSKVFYSFGLCYGSTYERSMG